MTKFSILNLNALSNTFKPYTHGDFKSVFSLIIFDKKTCCDHVKSLQKTIKNVN